MRHPAGRTFRAAPHSERLLKMPRIGIVLGIGIVFLLLTGCASMLPTQIVDGVAVYIRDAKTVDDYCRQRTAADQSVPGRRMRGCYIAKDRTIMVLEGLPEVLAHELRHARGENHVGACGAIPAHPDGLTPTGVRCEWYTR